MDTFSTIVASGSMQIKDGGLLRAYLGSCVGLALYDP
jgi:chemotaxis receptor (MCP) glutamine deamidase CheD